MLKQEGTCREKKSEKKQESPAFKAGHNKVRRHLQKGENTMKRRDFMKLSAATALGATVAAMAPSALAATELDQRRSAHYRRSQDRSYGSGRWQDLCL